MIIDWGRGVDVDVGAEGNDVLLLLWRGGYWSVRKGAAGRFSLLKRLAEAGLSAQA